MKWIFTHQLKKRLHHTTLPKHDDFKQSLFQELSSTYVQDEQAQDVVVMKKRWIVPAFSVATLALCAAVVLILPRLNSDSTHVSPAQKWAYAPAAFAASLEEAFGIDHVTTFWHRRFFLNNARFENQSSVREVWISPHAYRVDQYMQGQFFSSQYNIDTGTSCGGAYRFSGNYAVGREDAIQLELTKGSQPQCIEAGFMRQTAESITTEAFAYAAAEVTEENPYMYDFVVRWTLPEEMTTDDAYAAMRIENESTIYSDMRMIAFESAQNARLVEHSDRGYVYELHVPLNYFVMPQAAHDAGAEWIVQLRHAGEYSMPTRVNIVSGATADFDVNIDYTAYATELQAYTGSVENVVELVKTSGVTPEIVETYFEDQEAYRLRFASIPDEPENRVYEYIVLRTGMIVESAVYDSNELVSRSSVVLDEALSEEMIGEFFAQEQWMSDMQKSAVKERMQQLYVEGQ